MSKKITEKVLEIAEYAFDGLLVYENYDVELIKYVQDNCYVQNLTQRNGLAEIFIPALISPIQIPSNWISDP